MKKYLMLILCMLTFLLTGCADTSLDINILVFNANSSTKNLEVYDLFSDGENIKINKNPTYTFNLPLDDFEFEMIKYWDKEKLITTHEVLSSDENKSKNIIKADEEALFYENYYLVKVNVLSWCLSNTDNKIESELSFVYQGNSYTPICFFITPEKDDAYFLCTYLYEVKDFSVAIFHLSLNTNVISVKSIDDAMKKNEISPVQYPFDTSVVSVAKNGFLYNEGTRIYLIDAESAKMNMIFNENSIKKNMMFIDAYREIYTFFTHTAYQNQYYLLAFDAYNELKGSYIAIYSDTGNYYGYIYITENGIFLFDVNNNIKDRTEGNFKTYCYINKY